MKTKESVSPGGRRVVLERQALALSKRCPVDGANPGNCPLCDLRPLGLREKRMWIRGLTLSDLEYLVTYHACCAAEKQQALAGKRKTRPRAAKV